MCENAVRHVSEKIDSAKMEEFVAATSWQAQVLGTDLSRRTGANGNPHPDLGPTRHQTPCAARYPLSMGV